MTTDFSKVIVSEMAGYVCIIKDANGDEYNTELNVAIKPQEIEVDEDEFIEYQAKKYCERKNVEFASVEVDSFIDF